MALEIWIMVKDFLPKMAPDDLQFQELMAFLKGIWEDQELMGRPIKF